jgi:hypothetical protein
MSFLPLPLILARNQKIQVVRKLPFFFGAPVTFEKRGPGGATGTES